MNELPKGVTRRSDANRAEGFGGRFRSTVMGTAIFVAEMQRKVPLRTKLLVLVLLATAGGVGWFGWRMRQQTEAATAALTEALARPPQQSVTAIIALLEADHLDGAGRVLAYERLGLAKNALAVAPLARALARSGDDRRAAALALSRIGAPDIELARAALLQALDESTPEQSLEIGWALALIGDERGLARALDGLAEGQLPQVASFDGHLLAEAMGADGLRRAAEDPRAPVRIFALTHLGPRCDASTEPVLLAAARSPEAESALAAVVSLTQCGTPSALQGAAEALARDATLRMPARLAFSSSVGAPGLSLLLPFATDEAGRLELLQAIRASGDPRVGDFLLNPLGTELEQSARLRLATVEILAEVSDPLATLVAEPLFELEGDWPMAAARALGTSLDAQGVRDAVLPLTNRRELREVAFEVLASSRGCSAELVAAATAASRRGWTPALLRLLGRCGDPRALSKVASAIGRGGARGEVTRSDGELSLAAFDVIADGNLEEHAEALGRFVEDEGFDPRLRTAAAKALGVVASNEQRARALDMLLDSGASAPLRADALHVLRRGLPSRASDRLMGFLRSGADDARTSAAVELVGLVGGRELADELVALLEDERARSNAAFALALGAIYEEDPRPLVDMLTSRAALLGEVVAKLREVDFGFRRDTLPDQILLRGSRLRRLRALGLGGPWSAFVQALARGSEGPGGFDAVFARDTLNQMLSAPDSERRAVAAEALFELGLRGPLLAAREGAARDEVLRLLDGRATN